MKREKMLELLTIQISLGPEDPKELANYVLSFLEGQGMQPPMVKIIFPNNTFSPAFVWDESLHQINPNGSVKIQN